MSTKIKKVLLFILRTVFDAIVIALTIIILNKTGWL